jgi:hypothetical protein
MRNASKVVRKIGIDDVRSASKQPLFHVNNCLLGIAARTVSILFIREIRFENRFQYQHRCGHANSIS